MLESEAGTAEGEEKSKLATTREERPQKPAECGVKESTGTQHRKRNLQTLIQAQKREPGLQNYRHDEFLVVPKQIAEF